MITLSVSITGARFLIERCCPEVRWLGCGRVSMNVSQAVM